MRLQLSFIMLVFLMASCSSRQKDVFNESDSPEVLKNDISIMKYIFKKAHAGAFVYNDQASLEKLFDSVAAGIEQPLKKWEFLAKVDFIIDNIHCAHTDCYFPKGYYDSISEKKYFFPLPLIKIGNDIYLNSTSFTIPNGSRILSVNNNLPHEIISKISVHEHTDGFSRNYKDRAVNNDFAYTYFLEFGPAEKFTVRYINSDTKLESTKELFAETLNKIYDNRENDCFYYFPTDINYDFEILNSKTALLTIKTFDLGSFSQTLAFANFLNNSFKILRYESIKNLIIDFRDNTGGYYKNSFELIGHFISSPVKYFDSAIKRFNSLPLKEYIAEKDSEMKSDVDSSANDYIKEGRERFSLKQTKIDTCFPAASLFRGKLFIITNGDVISAAATTAALLKEKAKAIVVGEETGGGYAANNSKLITYVLPGSGISISVPLQRYYQAVSRQQKQNGVVPDFYKPITQKDFIENNDGPLKFILDSLIR